MSKASIVTGRKQPVALAGGAHIDRLVRTLARAVPGASNSGTVREAVGGVAANIARNLARLGIRARLLTRLGNDPAAERVLADCAAAGVDTAPVSRSATAPTASYHAILDADGSLIIGVGEMAVYDELTPAIVIPGLRPADGIWVLDANLPAATIEAVAERAEPGGPLVAGCAVSPEKAVRLIAVLSRLDILFCNAGEAKALLGGGATGADPARLAHALCDRGVARGLVSNGSAPLAAWDGGEVALLEPLPARVVSVNGAGDALAAGTLYGIAGGLGFLAAVRLGLAAAAIKVADEEPAPAGLSAARLRAEAGAVA